MFETVKMTAVPEGGRVVPGGRLLVALVLRNASPVVDRYHVTVEGVPPEWVTLDKDAVSLFPGTSERVSLTIAPPAGIATTAGAYPVAVVATSEDDPTAAARREVALEVGATGQLGMDLLPPDTEGRQGVFRVTFTNGSNKDQAVALQARDNEEGLRFRLEPEGPVSVPAGGERVVMARVWPKTRETIGQPHPYDVEFKGVVEGVDAADPLAAMLVRQGRYTYHPRITALALPRWLRRLPTWALLALLLALLLLMLLATNKPATAAVTAVARAINPPAKPARTPRPPRPAVPTVPPPPTKPAPVTPTRAPVATPTTAPPTKPAVGAPTKPAAAAIPTPGALPRIERFDVRPAAKGGKGGALGLDWAVAGARSVSLNGQPVGANGLRNLSLAGVTTLVLTARDAGGTVTRVLRVAPPHVTRVTKSVPPETLALPSIERFVAGTDPATGAFALLWRVARADGVTLDDRAVGAQGVLDLSVTDSSTHVLRASNSLGAVESSVVGPQGSPRATQQRAVAPPPAIERFVVAHERAGRPYTLVWRTRGASRVTLDGARVAATSSRALPAPLHSATYRLVAANGGGSATGEVRVLVTSH